MWKSHGDTVWKMIKKIMVLSPHLPSSKLTLRPWQIGVGSYFHEKKGWIFWVQLLIHQKIFRTMFFFTGGFPTDFPYRSMDSMDPATSAQRAARAMFWTTEARCDSVWLGTPGGCLEVHSMYQVKWLLIHIIHMYYRYSVYIIILYIMYIIYI